MHNYYGIKSYHSLGSVHSCEYLSMFPLSLCNRELRSVGDENRKPEENIWFSCLRNLKLRPRLSPSIDQD